MFNYITIDFPLSQNAPQRVSSFTLNQERYAHEIAVVRFRDWNLQYTNISPSQPVRCVFSGTTGTKEFVGYIHDIKPDVSPGKQFVEMTLIGASYRMKQARQKVYTNMTANQIIEEIGRSYNFSVFAEPHPRVFEQVSQTGHTDLELMTRLAKQCGYSLRIENTSIYFQPLTFDYTKERRNAPSFIMREANDPQGSTLYSFKLTLGESLHYPDAYKSAAQIGGVDPRSIKASVVTNTVRPEVLKEISTPEFFDSFATDIVAPGYNASYYEAQAIDQRNRFPYRAKIEVLGTPDLKPDQPVYLAGVGKDYSGYWIVLRTSHKIVETEPNILKYTTVVEVGADSIGTANVWQDGLAITAPSKTQIRVIKPRQKNRVPNKKSTLKQGSTKYNNSGFGNTKNRPSPHKGVVGHHWVSPDSDKDNDRYVHSSERTTSVVKRLRANGHGV